MKILSLYILNKAGGLIYQTDLNPGLARLSANDYLVLAGTMHGVHAIASKLSPQESKKGSEDATTHNAAILASGKARCPNSNSLGLEHIDTDMFSLYVFQTLTGIKFLIVTSPVDGAKQLGAPGVSQGVIQQMVKGVGAAYKELYQYYCDYVMKNSFYSLEMPIKCALFDEKVKAMASYDISPRA